jgi:hypothetical protein
MTNTCINHPQNAAVEQCEVCARPLCGLCLWYTEDGHRLCANHAQERQATGTKVLPPHTYQEAFAAGVVRNQEPAGTGEDRPISSGGATVYKGNSNDLLSLLAVVLGLVTLVSCFGGVYCLPFVGIALAAIAYINAGQSVDPPRTRRMAGIGLGISAAIFLILAAFIFMYIFFIIFAIVAANGMP